MLALNTQDKFDNDIKYLVKYDLTPMLLILHAKPHALP